MSKRIAYMDLLKEAVLDEFDTSKNVDVKGPFLDPIIGYDGNGELQTHKDASSILERYYFNEENDSGIQVETAEPPTVGDKDKPMEEVPPDSVDDIKDDIEDAVNMQYEQEENEQEENEQEENEDEENEDEGEDEDEEEMSESEKLEEAVIEKLIAEMEDDLAEMDFTKDQNNTEPAGDPDDDYENELPDRKDLADKFTKPAKLSELDRIFLEQEDEGEETLDVDSEVSEAALGPMHHPHDAESYEKLEEQFKIFSEEIEDMEDAEPVKSISSDDIRV